MATYDLAIIGGGVNGAAIARDAAGRGLRVLLVEQGDLGSGTSSASSKLIHGGLRYLEHGAFRLVREALTERELLLRSAPHVIRPMRFMLPPAPGLRSALKLRFGLFLYDRLGNRKALPPTRTADLTHHPVGVPLQRSYRFGFEYSDCWVDDARLVVLNAMDAAERGAAIRPRTRCVRAERSAEWELVLNARGRREVATARVLVNAAGPWVDQVSENILRLTSQPHARLIKGSHIVVRRMFDHDRGYTLEAPDGRVVFALPFAQNFTLIGTTDEPFVGDVNAPAPSPGELTYLIDVVNRYFRHKVSIDDVVWAFSGIRSLYDDGSRKPEDVTRDYHLTLDEKRRVAPVLTIYGGKITTARKLAEAVFERIGKFFKMHPPWTHHATLPGGDFAADEFTVQLTRARNRWPFLSADTAARMVQAYGTRIDRILGEAKSFDDLGPRFIGDLTGAELRYLAAQEWAQTADDVLWRRTKLGLMASGQDREEIARFLAKTLETPAK
ncbi:glycerol-3-phosphate dehydrogenase [Pseudolabrys sp.]|uniref:glycerol-3-phosphate dehydrogenase n=1 Tax=Pseudolabrys sp. TaxID=1960880 RepID=UPI003D0A0490